MFVDCKTGQTLIVRAWHAVVRSDIAKHKTVIVAGVGTAAVWRQPVQSFACVACALVDIFTGKALVICATNAVMSR